MPSYNVQVPIVGYLNVLIENVENHAAAIDEALATVWHAELDTEADADFGELELVREVCRGSVCYAPVTRAYATIIPESD